MSKDMIPAACEAITQETGLPAYDVLEQSADELIKLIKAYLK
jgi:uncharacterized NAD-dependent epimerase/dehydratase family protein